MLDTLVDVCAFISHEHFRVLNTELNERNEENTDAPRESRVSGCGDKNTAADLFSRKYPVVERRDVPRVSYNRLLSYRF